MSLKRQNQTAFSGPVVRSTWYGGSLLSTDTYLSLLTNYQETSSQSHPWPPLTKWEKTLDLGGGFISRKAEWIDNPVRIKSTNGPSGSIWYEYSGDLHAQSSDSRCGPIDLLAPTASYILDAAGTTAIARCIPTNPIAGLGQFLGELRQLPTKFTLHKWKPEARRYLDGWRQAGRNANSARKFSVRAANDWLNLQFGWLPFVKDILDFAIASKDADKIIRQFQRDSGKVVRRSYNFPMEVGDNDTSVYPFGRYGEPAPQTFLVKTPGQLVTTRRTSSKRWFKGAFTYYLPKNKLLAIEAKANQLFGLRITPELLWKLAPWSWAIDWVNNTGDVIHNWSAFTNDGLVMKYGYIMETKSASTEYLLAGLELEGVQGTVSPNQVLLQVNKTRQRATPYGFGLDPGGFSDRQWSIIAALGISKAPRSLNF